MTGQHPGSAGCDDAELDAMLDSAMSGIVTRLETSLDPETGLADVHARWRALYPRRHPPTLAEAHSAGSARQAASRALQQICDQIDVLDACLAAIGGSAGSRPFPGMTFLDMARPVLLQLRSGLANKVLARAEAEDLTGAVQQYLDRAHQVLQAQRATTLEEAVRQHAGDTEHGTLGGQVRGLQDKIAKLYASAGATGSLVQAT
jgi:hypothetical protein